MSIVKWILSATIVHVLEYTEKTVLVQVEWKSTDASEHTGSFLEGSSIHQVN